MTEPLWIQISPISPRGSSRPSASITTMWAPGHGNPTLSICAAVNSGGMIVEGDVVSVAP